MALTATTAIASVYFLFLSILFSKYSIEILRPAYELGSSRVGNNCLPTVPQLLPSYLRSCTRNLCMDTLVNRAYISLMVATRKNVMKRQPVESGRISDL